MPLSRLRSQLPQTRQPCTWSDAYYRTWATPFEIFSRMPQCESFLRPGVKMEDLERLAKAQSDTEAAIEMQQAKRRLNSVTKRSA